MLHGQIFFFYFKMVFSTQEFLLSTQELIHFTQEILPLLPKKVRTPYSRNLRGPNNGLQLYGARVLKV